MARGMFTGHQVSVAKSAAVMKASPSTRTAKGRSHVVLQKNKHVYTPSLARRYHGFCPWKERPNGGALPEIDRIVVDEHISSCNDCCDASLKRNGRGDEVICTRCFFNSFIIKRRPCLLRLVKSQNQDDGRTEYSLADCRALRYWKDLDYLDQAAGDETIDVEVRDTKMPDSFGRGQYKQLGFREVLKRLREGDTSLYVSTQRIASDKYGPKLLCGPPLSKSLSSDFPVNPAIAGNLVPSQFNIWMGHSCVGSSTGLHHDFHDNFYCLVRGRKEFRLYSPRLCELLRTQGMAKPLSAPSVHPNGLISYIRGIREDGAHELSVLRTRQLTLERTTNALREQLAGCEKRLQAASEGKNTTELKMEAKKLKDMLDHAESELDHCLEAALDAAAYESGVDDDDSTSNDSELMEGRLVQEGAYPDHFCLTGTEQPCTTSWDGPLNAANVLKRFWSVWVEEGDILYLPASWFHEVISYSSGTQKDSEKLSGTPADTKDSVHLAFNIWMHPPCLDGTFEKPYIDGYWAQHAAQQVEKQKAASVSALVYNQKYLRAFPLQRHTAQQDERSHQQDSSGGAHGSRLACHIPYSADDAEAVISPPKCVRSKSSIFSHARKPAGIMYFSRGLARLRRLYLRSKVYNGEAPKNARSSCQNA